MSRSLLSQFLILPSTSHGFTSSITSVGIPGKLLEHGGLIRRRRLQIGRTVTGCRSNCSFSLSEPAVSASFSTPVKKRVVSGVQPTGSIHLGNYLGAIRNWIPLQDTYDTFFFIVDLHAITLQYDPKQLSKATRDTAAIYLACGVDTSKASVFVQSHVRAHVELMWLLCSATPIGWLNKMIQFKEKSRKAANAEIDEQILKTTYTNSDLAENKDQSAGEGNVGVALLTYPVLMASDILLYQGKESKAVIYQGYSHNGLYSIHMDVMHKKAGSKQHTPNHVAVMVSAKNDSNLWHRRLGHPAAADVTKLML